MNTKSLMKDKPYKVTSFTSVKDLVFYTFPAKTASKHWREICRLQKESELSTTLAVLRHALGIKTCELAKVTKLSQKRILQLEISKNEEWDSKTLIKYISGLNSFIIYAIKY